jgi:hypothetical protein
VSTHYSKPEIVTLSGSEIIERFGPMAGGSSGRPGGVFEGPDDQLPQRP